MPSVFPNLIQIGRMKMRTLLLPLFVLLWLPLAASAVEVNVYSARKGSLLRPVLDLFTAQSGIKVNLLAAKGPDLLRRLDLERASPVTDVFLATDAADLVRAANEGLLQPLPNTASIAASNSEYNDPELRWVGLSMRARALVYSKKRVDAAILPEDYLQLADEKWRGKICVRSSNSPYNQSLVAALLHHYGSSVVAAWVKDFVANFSRSPQGGDRDQIRALALGVCDLALVNTYYLGTMLHSADQSDAKLLQKAEIAVYWPQQGKGVHVNLSGAGIVAAAANREAAATLIDFLLQRQAQQWFVEHNHEYPVHAGVPLSESLLAWGHFTADTEAILHLEQNRIAAIQLMDSGGWR